MSETPLLPRHLAERVLAGRSEIEGERKSVTVMFADVVGSTAMADRLDPEDVVDLLNGLFARWVDAVHRYEGTVDKFLGDGMLALFGAPLAHEDHARRAVHAALEIRDATGVYAAQLTDVDLDVRIGLNTGRVVVGAVGSDARMEYTAIGDAVNVAQRVEASAEPGTVFISDAVRRLVGPYFEIEEAGRFALKGKPEPVPLYRAVADRGVTRTVRGVEGLDAPLVGRDQELARLERALSTLESGRGGSISIVGEAGLGKSRLLGEARLRATAAGLLWLEGHALSFGSTTPYLAVREFLVQLDRSATDDLFDRVSGLDAEARHREVVAGVRRLVVAAAPVVVAVEDLHWADVPSLDVVEALCRVADEAQVLVIVNSRPEGGELTGRMGADAIELSPLDPDHSAELVRAFLELDRIPPGLRAAVLDKAQGNPFFMEELLRGLIDTGVLELRSGEWHATRDSDEVPLPETLEGLIAARIDRLPDQAKDLLQAASVLGRTFEEPVLRRVVDSGLDSLDLLTGRGFLLAEPGDGMHAFKHVLTQEAAYGGMLRKKRRHLHGLAAAGIESVHGDELELRSAELARHWDEAGEVERAVRYYGKAAARAVSEYANDAATSLLNRGLELAAHPRERFELFRLAATVGLRRGALDEAGEAVAGMRAIASDVGDPDLRLAALVAAAEVEVKGDYLTARSALDVALAEAAERRDGAARGRLLRMLAVHHASQYAPGRAIESLTEAIELLEAHGLWAEHAAALGQLSRAHAMASDLPEARRWSDRAVEAARRLGDTGMVAQALLRTAGIAIEDGDFGLVIELAEEACAVAREIGSIELEGQSSQWKAYACAASGAVQEADLHYEDARRLARRSGNEWSWLLSVMGMVESWESSQRIGELLGWLRATYEETVPRGHRHNTAYFHYALGYRALRWLGAWDEALAEARLGVEMIDDGEFQPPRVMFRNAVAAILLEQGRLEAARSVLDEGAAIARQHETLDVTGSYLNVTDGRLALLEGDFARVQQAVDELRSVSGSWTGAGERQAASVLSAEVALARGQLPEARALAEEAVGMEPLSAAVARFFSTPQVLDLRARVIGACGDDPAEAWRAAAREVDRWVTHIVPAQYRVHFEQRPEVARIRRHGI
ncbi:MAG TPA: adenylate/guanylate cyclase domain-containing protein [Acidimicrobiia bacterium]